MTLTIPMVLIACVGVFLGSFMDAIAGGGGIITVPTYLLAGLPMHQALGTNKLSAAIGTVASAARFIRSGNVNWPLAAPSVLLALVGSALGTKLQLLVAAEYLQYMLLAVLPVVAIVVLRQHEFPEEPGEIAPRRQFAIVLSAALVVGAYDGFYGPGTGTFLLLIFTRWAKMDLRTAAGNVKVVNLASNLGALFTAILYGQAFWTLGLISAVFAFGGHYFGAGLALKNGSKIVRPVVLLVLVLLTLKVCAGLL
ncbi:MAG: TSUP family transporter [Oscillospiraceae bacterium]